MHLADIKISRVHFNQATLIWKVIAFMLLIEMQKITTNAIIELPRDRIKIIRLLHRNKMQNVVAMESKDYKNSKQLLSDHILINRSKNKDGDLWDNQN